ncbi:uncharacterized protein LOC108743261 isoform X2 [Agrilus planipennis]|uniref:Uncharacterized protein LOC108743261 isoform X2 n=1 Tax=Agrilus planipennis TaxID=224129 RepID=A0A1W4XNA6_AGRPL|nr:uncharacterized protein LOC108743261 isoform X2 [Agrilus planipennis]
MTKVGDRKHHFSTTLWAELYKSREAGDKAVYIDIDDEEKVDDYNKIYSRWSELPDLVLERIFSYLTMRQKYYASLVCKNWHRAFYLQYVWSHFILADSTLTRGRFNYYSGWQYVLDHLRTQLCLTCVGKSFRHLTFEPMLNFYNLYEFMNMVSWYIEQAYHKQEEDMGIGCNIRSLKFTFPCDMSSREETERIRLFGTGGKLLAALKRLMGNLKKLVRLELIDLMLHPEEAQHLLDEVCDSVGFTLKYLSLINTTRVPCQILHVGVLLNLQVLKISPQNLGEDMVELIGYTNLRHLHILQNQYTPSDSPVIGVSPKIWKVCRKNNSKLCVHLEVISNKKKCPVWQEGAPVRSVLFDSPQTGLHSDVVMNAIEFYKKDLRVFGHKNVPRFYQPKSFHERIDGLLLLLCGECLHLQTLVVTERISTCTILLIAQTTKNIHNLFIRRNAVIKRCDWPKNSEWSDDFYEWLKINSRNYELVEKEVSRIIGNKWRMLSDKEFKVLNINLH